MKMCFLTQTASDISDYYKSFFKGFDLFFITFKTPNERAVAYLPNSSWSEGRNRLWEEVKGRYDYYIFMDDDLRFLKPRLNVSPYNLYLLQKVQSAVLNRGFQYSYNEASSEYFIQRLLHSLNKYSPEVLSVVKFYTAATQLDIATLKADSFIRPMGWFDAEFTVLSQFAASKMLPYDTKLSGWVSAQIPIYVYAHEVFATKAVIVLDLAANNTRHTPQYFTSYDGLDDCRNMLRAMTEATGRNFDSFLDESSGVDLLYGKEEIIAGIPNVGVTQNYAENFSSRLKGLDKLIHPNMNFM